MNAGIDNGGNTMELLASAQALLHSHPRDTARLCAGRGDVQSANARTGMLDDIQTHFRTAPR